MTEDTTNIAARICAAVGACVALFSTFLPWYSFDVVLPGAHSATVFAVTTTLWGFTTLAPILIAAGAVAVLVLVGVVDLRPTAMVAAGIGLAMLAYGIVRCFVLPHLGVTAITPTGLITTRAATMLEGGPFVEIAGGMLVVTGGLASLWPSAVPYARERPAAEWGGPSTAAPMR